MLLADFSGTVAGATHLSVAGRVPGTRLSGGKFSGHECAADEVQFTFTVMDGRMFDGDLFRFQIQFRI